MESQQEKARRLAQAWHAMQNFLSFLTPDEYEMVKRAVRSIEKILFRR